MAHEIDDMVYENTRAKAQALADVQEQQIENERRRRVAEENRAAFDAARDAERNRRGGSVFSFTPSVSVGKPDGIAGTVSNTVFGPQTGGMPLRYEQAIPSNPVFAGMSELAERENAINAHNGNLKRDSILSTWMLARNNGGRLQQNALGQLTRNLGMDGKTSAVAGAALAKNGDLVLNVATKAPNGQISLSPQVITKKQLYDLGCASDGSITPAGLLQGVRNELVNSGFASNSLAKIPDAEWAQQRQARAAQKQSADEMKTVLDYYQALQKEAGRSNGGRQPMSVADIRMRLAEKIMADPKLGPEIMRVPDMNEDGTQKMVEDENGQQVPAMRMADPDNEEDQKRVRQNMAMRLNQVPDLRQGPQDGQADQDLARRMAMFDHIYNRVNPPPSPEVAAFQQRQRQRQIADIEREQARADVMQGGQRLIKYRDAQGRLVTGNGYFHNGRLYDPHGDEIAGAEPLEVNGKEVRGLPSAAALVNGGSAGAGAEAGAATAQPAQAQTAGQTAQTAQTATQPTQAQPAAQAQGEAATTVQQPSLLDRFQQWWQTNVLGTAQQKQDANADMLDLDNLDAFVKDLDKGLSPERGNEIKRQIRAEAEIRRRQQQGEPIDDKDWADITQSLNETTDGVVRRDMPTEARVRFAEAFDDIVPKAQAAAQRSVELDAKYVGPEKGIKYEDAYRAAFARFAKQKINSLSKDELRKLEYIDPDNIKSKRVNLRQSLFDRYGIDIYDDDNLSLGDKLTGDGGISARGFYEDLIDSDGKVRKGSWRRGGDAYRDFESSVSVGRQ